MAASAFQSTIVGRARTTVVSPTGIEQCVHLVRPFARQRRADQVRVRLRRASGVGKSECIDRRTSFVRRTAHGFGFRSPAYSKSRVTIRSRQIPRPRGVSICMSVN